MPLPLDKRDELLHKAGIRKAMALGNAIAVCDWILSNRMVTDYVRETAAEATKLYKEHLELMSQL